VKKTVKAWQVFYPYGDISWGDISPNKKLAIFLRTKSEATWRQYYKSGYRVRPITITYDDGRKK